MYPEQYAYPHFTPNQVLSDGDLNLLSDYLNEQGRLTRSHLIGVGIVCGLRGRRADSDGGPGFRIERGCGVTATGQLIVWDDDRQLRYRQPYKSRGGRAADFFGGDKGPELWELTADDNPDNQLLTGDFLRSGGGDAGLALMLVHEAREIDNRNCSRTNCDEKGVTVEHTVRPVLIGTADLDRLMREESGERAYDRHLLLRQLRNRRDDAPILSRVRLHRWRMPTVKRVSTHAILSSFQTAILRTLEILGKELPVMERMVRPLLTNEEEGLNPGLGYLREENMLAGPHALDLPYYYDHLRHVVAACEELRHAAEEHYRECLPDPELFPHHLVLHRVTFAGLEDDLRTPWISSPATNRQQRSLSRLTWRYRRLAALLADVRLRDIPDELPEVFRPAKRIAPVFWFNPGYTVMPTFTYFANNWSGAEIAEVAAVDNLLDTNFFLGNIAGESVARMRTMNFRQPPAEGPALAELLRVPEGEGGEASGAESGNRIFARLREDLSSVAITRGRLRERIRLPEMRIDPSLLLLNPVAPRLTPGSLTAALSARPQPQYYRTERLPGLWNFERTIRGRHTDLAGYHARSWDGDTEALDYDLGPHQFVRIEDVVGAPVGSVQRLLAERLSAADLPIDMVVLTTGQLDGVDHLPLGTPDFADLQSAYLAQSHDMLADLLEVLVSIYDLPVPTEQEGEDDGPRIPTRHSIFRLFPDYRYHRNTVGALLENQQVSGVAGVNLLTMLARKVIEIADTVPATLVAYGNSDYPTELRNLLHVLRRQASSLTTLLITMPDVAGRILGPMGREVLHLYTRLLTAADRPSLDALFRQYEQRRENLEQSRVLDNFRRRHPGLRPACGVPLGGTYVLLCHGGGNSAVRSGNFVVNGVVVDRNEPVDGATIRIANSQKSAKTGTAGHFSLNTDSLPVQLTVQAEGYPLRHLTAYAVTDLKVDLSKTAAEEPGAFPGVGTGTVIADFYLPYRIGDGTAPVQVFSPAVSEKPEDPTEPTEPTEPDEPEEPVLPFDGRALRYRYPFWGQEPAWKLIIFEGYRPELLTVAVDVEDGRLSLSDAQMDELNEKLGEAWNGRVDGNGWPDRVEATRGILKEIGPMLAGEDERFDQFNPLDVEILQEEGFYFFRFTHFGEVGRDSLRIDLRLTYTEAATNDRLTHVRTVSYSTDQATFVERDADEAANILSAARATADRSVSEAFDEPENKELPGSIWIEAPNSVGTDGLQSGSTAFVEIGPAVPAAITTTGQSVRVEMPVQVTDESGGGEARALIVDAESGSYRIVSTRYVTV